MVRDDVIGADKPTLIVALDRSGEVTRATFDIVLADGGA